MTGMISPAAILTCPPSLRWVKDTHQILIIDERLNSITTLHAIEASVWDWLMLGYAIPDLTGLLAALCHESQEQAETRLLELLKTWLKSGLLVWQGEENG